MIVSVVMPLYNAARFLPQAIDSIIAQTLTDWELIAVCEPNSVDSTNEVIAQYAAKDSRIKPINNATRLGIAASINAGIRTASGEFIARMDADDISCPKRFEKQVVFLRANPDITILGSNIQFIDKHDKQGAHITKYPQSHEQIKAGLLFYCEIMHPAVMMRKEDIEKHNLYYDEAFIASEDFELWNRASRVVKLANHPDILLYYRWGMDTSTRNNTGEGDKNYIAVIDRSCRKLGLEFTAEELRLLYPRTCDMNLSNSKCIRSKLENAAKRIIDANAEVLLYEPNALKSTLDKRLHWQQHPVRWIAAATLRTIGGHHAFINGLAGYIEQRGFGMTMRRIMQLR